MKLKCDLCAKTTYHNQDTYICSYENTYCPECASDLNYNCQECKGELVLRPKRILPEKAFDPNLIA